MTALAFSTVLARVLSHEGGYVNDPRDPGGETKYGISKRSYPKVDIKALTYTEAGEIYYHDFWKPVAKNLHPAVCFQMFDAAVNHGMGNAVRMLQRAVDVADDGHWGPQSQAAYDLISVNVSDVLLIFLAKRLRFMAKLSTFKVYGSGWSVRIADNMQYAAEDN